MGGAVGRGVRGAVAATEVTKPQTFDGTPLKVSRFVGVCKLYIRMNGSIRRKLMEAEN